MLPSPDFDLGRGRDAGIIDDHVQEDVPCNLVIQAEQESEECLLPMTLVALAGNFVLEVFQCRQKHRELTMYYVVVRPP
jgi:hypothetical protein